MQNDASLWLPASRARRAKNPIRGTRFLSRRRNLRRARAWIASLPSESGRPGGSRPWVAGVLFASAVIYQLIFGDHSTRLNVQTERITISTVERGPFQEFIPVRGEVLPIQTIFLDAQENGRVEAVYLEAGAMVQKGDSILKLANPELELKVMDQEALYYEQVNNFENTRITLTTTSISRQQQLLQLEQNVLRRKQEFDQKTELHRIGHLSDRSYQIDKDDFSFFERRLEFM